MGRECVTMTTPRGVEINEPRILTVQDDIVELLLVNLLYHGGEMLKNPRV